MNKSELVDFVATETGATKASSARAVEAVFKGITQTLKQGGTVALSGFGSFSVVKRAARTARNPLTGEQIKVKARKAPVFKAGAGLKNLVNDERPAKAKK